MPAHKPAAAPSVAATYVRGGTSKAVFLHEKDVPPEGPVRDQFLIRIMGSPDPNQIDGMGGTRIVTSKVAIIRPSKRPDADVDYTFCQIALGESKVSYDANCGNISAGVGPFAINEDLLSNENYRDGNRVVRIYNTGKGVVLVAHVPIDEATGRAMEKGTYVISGCPGSGAEILMDYSKTAKPENMSPTGKVIDRLDCTFGSVDATFCDVGNQIVFVTAKDLGIAGNETREQIDANTALLKRVSEVRGRIATQLRMCTEWSKVDDESPLLPMLAFVSKPTSKEGSIQSRLILDNHCHQSMAGTGAICTTTVSRIEGSVVNRLLAEEAKTSSTFQIQHPAGHFPVTVKTEEKRGADGLPVFDVLGFGRTARYLFQGRLFIPADFLDVWKGPE